MRTNDIRIIRADLSLPAHRAALLGLLNEYCLGSTGELRPLSPAVRRRMAKDLAANPAALVYFALCGELIVGCAVCFVGYSTWLGRRLINVHDLAVTQSCRRKGVATKLLKAIEDTAKKKGYCKVTLEVRCDNKAALRLYEKAGFGFGWWPMFFMTKVVGKQENDHVTA